MRAQRKLRPDLRLPCKGHAQNIPSRDHHTLRELLFHVFQDLQAFATNPSKIYRSKSNGGRCWINYGWKFIFSVEICCTRCNLRRRKLSHRLYKLFHVRYDICLNVIIWNTCFWIEDKLAKRHGSSLELETILETLFIERYSRSRAKGYW